MQIQYLEIVTPKVDETCMTLGAQHGIAFSTPVAELGNARTAMISGGGRVGVRKMLRNDEEPVVRPYMLVEDIEGALAAAEAQGAQIAMQATEIPGQGKFAIYTLGGIQLGLWNEPKSAGNDCVQQKVMHVQYLEIVTSKVNATRAILAAQHGVEFRTPAYRLGRARTAPAACGGRIAVRAPVTEHEEPVIRPYMLVKDIKAASNIAAKAQGTQSGPMQETDIPGQGRLVLYALGDIQHGLWQH